MFRSRFVLRPSSSLHWLKPCSVLYVGISGIKQIGLQRNGNTVPQTHMTGTGTTGAKFASKPALAHPVLAQALAQILAQTCRLSPQAVKQCRRM